jgi:hypothetical protein
LINQATRQIKKVCLPWHYVAKPGGKPINNACLFSSKRELYFLVAVYFSKQTFLLVGNQLIITPVNGGYCFLIGKFQW